MKSFRYIAYVLMAAATISLVSCKKEDEYVPAEKETGLQVYFSYETPTTYNLSEEGSFTVPIYRNEYSSAATVQLTSTADSPLTAPAEVSFASGQNRADLVVSYDFAALEEGKSYTASFAVANETETTVYGLSSLKVSASLPSSWIDFMGPDGTTKAKVTFTQGFWGEVHTGYIHYTVRADGSRFCETYDEEGDISGKYEPGPGFWGQDADQHFQFIWYPDLKDANGYDRIQVVPQVIYTHPDNGDMYWIDAYNFDRVQGYTGTFEEYFVENPDNPCSYYDGNGGFYFYLDVLINSKGSGYSYGTMDVVGIADGYERTIDYNTLDWTKYLKGDVTSEFYGNGGEPETWSDQVLSYSDSDSTLFFMPGYFDEEHGLAFKDEVSESLVFTTDDKITDVDNEQDTGIALFGQEVFIEVKKGNVTAVDEETGFPTISLVLGVYTRTQDEEGNWSEDPVSDFGMVTETITFNKTAGYSFNDLSGMAKANYTALYYKNSAVSTQDGERYEIAETYFVDDGTDSDGYEWIMANGFSGWSSKYWTKGDSLSIEWYNGFLYMAPQDINGNFVYGGSPYTITECLYDGQYFYNGGYLLGGLVEADNVLTFVNFPYNEDEDGPFEAEGLIFLDLTGEQPLSIGGYMEYILAPAGYAAPENKGIKMKPIAGKMRTTPARATKVDGTVTTLDGKQLKSAKRAESQKVFKLQSLPKQAPQAKDLSSLPKAKKISLKSHNW